MNRHLRKTRPVGQRWRELRVALDLPAEEVAPALQISAKYLQNIESNQPYATVSDRLAVRASHYFKVPVTELMMVVEAKDGVPDEPPQKEQEQETNTGPKPRKDNTKKGPKRASGAAA